MARAARWLRIAWLAVGRLAFVPEMQAKQHAADGGYLVQVSANRWG